MLVTKWDFLSLKYQAPVDLAVSGHTFEFAFRSPRETY
jgi:hypothetical protein